MKESEQEIDRLTDKKRKENGWVIDGEKMKVTLISLSRQVVTSIAKGKRIVDKQTCRKWEKRHINKQTDTIYTTTCRKRPRAAEEREFKQFLQPMVVI